MRKELLIIGIDPGTTTGYAMLDLKGRPVEVGSARNLGSDELTRIIEARGSPVALGCDRTKTPGLAESIASRFGAKLISPKEDLKVDEKRTLASGMQFANAHEMDALASAVFAFRQLERLLNRTDRFLELRKKQELADRVKELVIKKEMSMSAALELLEKPETEPARIIKKVIEQKKTSEKDFIRIYNELVQLRNEIMLLKQQNARLSQLQSALKKQGEKQKIIIRETNDGFKEKKILAQARTIAQKQAEINALMQKISAIENAILDINDFVVAKKLKNLGWNEYCTKKEALKLKKGDILLVEDANEHSPKTLDELRKNENIIVHKKPAGKLSYPLLISADGIRTREQGNLAFLEKKAFETARQNTELLRKIVEDYKKRKA